MPATTPPLTTPPTLPIVASPDMIPAALRPATSPVAPTKPIPAATAAPPPTPPPAVAAAFFTCSLRAFPVLHHVAKCSQLFQTRWYLASSSPPFRPRDH